MPWRVAVTVYAALIFVVSIVPVHGGPSILYLDKAVHLGEYFLLAWLLVQALRHYHVWAWLYATSYGVLIELIQAMVPWRSAEAMDALANAIGAACGVWVGKRLAMRAH
jgi:VanZ family protein